jgi:predicted RNA-binding protein with TRAM domain
MRFRRFRPTIPRPVKVGEEYDVEIKEVGSKGDGIARIKNFVVFVKNSKKGEKLRIKITEVYNRFAIAEKREKEEAKKYVEEATDVTETVVKEAEEEAKETGE